jgi:hypothetical protein
MTRPSLVAERMVMRIDQRADEARINEFENTRIAAPRQDRDAQRKCRWSIDMRHC